MLGSAAGRLRYDDCRQEFSRVITKLRSSLPHCSQVVLARVVDVLARHPELEAPLIRSRRCCESN